ncbi:SGNH/GDSL hydrolase family protein [Sulfurimonas sp.]|uniref:SGNH/GDSL hydrolase family protein n=1 Tax=Sulfurimonas sp. TaxID=2022749 RepID=UPI0025CE6C10|nr:SGNH/GDSL hydrolase family protein [Sulfurimonas sp.]MCK9453837.1 SGNH/GDSL hydrolase family protein [Sulfurimonas sp.]
MLVDDTNKRVLIIGDSTTMWIRPYRKSHDDLTYIELLRKQNYQIDVVSKPGMTSSEAVKYYWNNSMASFYDICIISVGINDLTPRNYPRWLWKINNEILVSNSYFEKLIQFIYRLVTYSKFQTLCAKFGMSRPWVSKNAFKLYLLKLQKIIIKESNTKMVFLSLPMVSSRVENIFPGIENNVIKYKKVFNELQNERTLILDIENIFKYDRQRFNPEGIHYSADGHKRIFEELIKIIEME